jgi:hypothetical protein
MTIADALTKAAEDGYHMHGADGVDTHCEGATSDFSAWTRADNQACGDRHTPKQRMRRCEAPSQEILRASRHPQ